MQVMYLSDFMFRSLGWKDAIAGTGTTGHGTENDASNASFSSIDANLPEISICQSSPKTNCRLGVQMRMYSPRTASLLVIQRCMPKSTVTVYFALCLTTNLL